MGKREKKQTGNKKMSWDLLIPILAGIVLVVSLGKLISVFWGYHQEAADNKKIEETFVTWELKEATEQEEEVQEETLPYPALNVDFTALQDSNEDTVAWFYWGLFDLSYPVVQGADNEEYIHKSFNGEYAKAGTLFLDSGNAADFTSRHSIIYGHDMKDRSMFGKLKLLLQDTDVEEDPYFYIFTETEVRKYRVFAYSVISPEDSLYSAVNSDEEYDTHINRALSLSAYRLPEEEAQQLKERPALLSLSTCYQHSRRTLVQGYLQEVFSLDN